MSAIWPQKPRYLFVVFNNLNFLFEFKFYDSNSRYVCVGIKYLNYKNKNNRKERAWSTGRDSCIIPKVPDSNAATDSHSFYIIYIYSKLYIFTW